MNSGDKRTFSYHCRENPEGGNERKVFGVKEIKTVTTKGTRTKVKRNAR